MSRALRRLYFLWKVHPFINYFTNDIDHHFVWFRLHSCTIEATNNPHTFSYEENKKRLLYTWQCTQEKLKRLPWLLSEVASIHLKENWVPSLASFYIMSLFIFNTFLSVVAISFIQSMIGTFSVFECGALWVSFTTFLVCWIDKWQFEGEMLLMLKSTGFWNLPNWQAWIGSEQVECSALLMWLHVSESQPSFFMKRQFIWDVSFYSQKAKLVLFTSPVNMTVKKKLVAIAKVHQQSCLQTWKEIK